MPNPKIAVPLVQPLTENDTREAVRSALRTGVARDDKAHHDLAEARTELESQLKAGRELKLTWPMMLELSGFSRGLLSRIFKNDTPPAIAIDRDGAAASIRAAAMKFWEAKEARDERRAERNELVRRAYMGDVPVSEIAELIGATADRYVYDILHGDWSKQLAR